MVQRLIPEEYNKRVNQIHKGSIIILSKYIKSDIKVLAKCVRCGYEFNIFPYNLLVKQKPCDVCSGLLEKRNKKLKFKNESQSDRYKLYKINDIWENENPGIYFIFDESKILRKIGSTKIIRSRLLNHKKENETYTYANYIIISNEKERKEAEIRLINTLKSEDNYWDAYSYNFTKIPKNKFREDNRKLYENKLAREISEERSGIFFVFDQNDSNLLYIDKANNIRKEINNYCKNKQNYYANYIVMADDIEKEIARKMLITLFKPLK